MASNYGPDDCHYRGGSYGSPKTAHCKARRLPKGLLCEKHEEAWRKSGRTPNRRKSEASTKPTVTKRTKRDAAAVKAVACSRCGADKGADCVWGKKPSKRVHADRLRLAEAVSTK